MAITRCGHTELLINVIAGELELEPDDVESAILNAVSHRFFQSNGLSVFAERHAVAKAVKHSLGSGKGLFGE